jgi:transposase, IS5 family
MELAQVAEQRRSLSVEIAIKAKGRVSKLMHKGHRWLPAERLEAHYRPLRPVRARVEKIFGMRKRRYHFRCMRWMGLAKAKCQVHLTAIAYNLKRYWRLQTA